MALTDLDRQILERCLRRDPEGWKAFVERFTGLFYHVIQHTAYARSVRLQPADLEDICAQIFLTIVADDCAVLRRFRRRASLTTYLTVIARRVVVRELIKRRLEAELGHTELHLLPPGVTGNELQRSRDREEIDRMLSQLSEREAELVRLHHLEGKSYREISELLGIAENSIGPALSRAREKLRGLVPVEDGEEP